MVPKLPPSALDLEAVAKKAIEDMPPATRFGPEDAAVIAEHREVLAGLKEAFVRGFYDTLFAHPPTAAVFKEGERPVREGTLAFFYDRVLEGPHDQAFLTWLAYVGPVHVVRGVSNPMMLAMVGYLVNFVAEHAHDLPQGPRLTAAFVRLGATLGAIISYGYEAAWRKALENVVGIPEALAQRAALEEAQRLFPLRGQA